MDHSKKKRDLFRSFIHSSPMLGRFFLHGLLHATSPGSGFYVRLVSTVVSLTYTDGERKTSYIR